MIKTHLNINFSKFLLMILMAVIWSEANNQ